MIIKDLVYKLSTGKRNKARKTLILQLAIGLFVATTAASLGIVTGVLIAPKSGEKTREDLKKTAANTVAPVAKAVLEMAEDK